MNLTLSKIRKYKINELIQIIKKNREIVLTIGFKSSYGYNCPEDYAYDYLWALFIGENIAQYCTNIKAESKYSSVVYTFTSKNSLNLAEKLLWLATPFEEDSPEDINFQEIYSNFCSSLENKKLYFPEIADRYFANLMGGDFYPDDDDEYYYCKYPEQKFGFWKSFASKNIGYDFYVSHDSWIVPMNIDVQDLLLKFGGFENEAPYLEKANYLSSANKPSIVINDRNAIYFPEFVFGNASKCITGINKKVLYDKSKSYSAEETKKLYWSMNKRLPDRNSHLGVKEKYFDKAYLSVNGDILILQDDYFQHIFFINQDQKVNEKTISKYLNTSEKILENIRQYLGIPSNIVCPWNTLDDEQFELLCYDIILKYYQPKIDRIHKMGNSRSRDGGRDIVFYKSSPIGQVAQKWISQCKLIKNGNSLTASKVNNVSDTIFQYESQGYCIMTNSVIDSALHDKLDNISRNMNIKIAKWSGLEIERFLSKHIEIKNRYFNN